jgi:hypothetical protein
MEKNKHAVELGKLGGLKSAKMSKEQREKIMRPVWDKTKERWAKLREEKQNLHIDK